MQHIIIILRPSLVKIAAGDSWGAKEVGLPILHLSKWLPLKGENVVVVVFDIFLCEFEERSSNP